MLDSWCVSFNLKIFFVEYFDFLKFCFVYTYCTLCFLHGENFMANFTTPSVVIWFSTGTLGVFATLVYTFTMRVVIYDTLRMAIIPTLSTSILFCNLCYILLWISLNSMGKIAKGDKKINFTMLYGNYCYINIENFLKKFSPCTTIPIPWNLISEFLCFGSTVLWH